TNPHEALPRDGRATAFRTPSKVSLHSDQISDGDRHGEQGECKRTTAESELGNHPPTTEHENRARAIRETRVHTVPCPLRNWREPSGDDPHSCSVAQSLSDTDDRATREHHDDLLSQETDR